MLDEFDLPFEAFNPAQMRAILSGQVAVASAPVWLRQDASPPPVHLAPLSATGMSHIPTPPPRRRDRRAGFESGVRRGPGAAARLVPRLRSVPAPVEPSG